MLKNTEKAPLSTSQRVLFTIVNDPYWFNVLLEQVSQQHGWKVFHGELETLLAQHLFQQGGKVNDHQLERETSPLFKYIQWLLMEGVVTAQYIDRNDFLEMTDTLKKEFRQRVMFEAGQSLTPVMPFHEMEARLAQAEQTIMTVLENLDGIVGIKDSAATALEQAQEWEKGNQQVSSVPYTLSRVQNKLGGLPRGGQVLLFAPTGAGKTAWLQHQVLGTARAGGRVLHETLEVSPVQLAHRFASSMSDVNLNDLRNRRATPAEWERYYAALHELKSLPILFGEKAGITPQQLGRKLRMVSRLHGRVELVVVDFGRLMGSDEKTANEARRTETIMYGLHETIKNFRNPDGSKAAMLVIAEMNREGQKRSWQGQDSLPTLLDLKQGGEYAASAILALHNVYETREARDTRAMLINMGFDPDAVKEGDTWLVVLKNREGETGIITGLHYEGRYTRWTCG